jgi:hypothetical protein
VNQDFKDLLAAFVNAGVRFLIIGISREDLIKNKEAVGRLQDLADAEKLRETDDQKGHS